MQVTLPTMTFDRSLILRHGPRTVEILWLGRAHTDGDGLRLPPQRKVSSPATPSTGWTPFMGDSYPYDWIQTLDAAEKLDFKSGARRHGDVMHGKTPLRALEQYSKTSWTKPPQPTRR